MTLLEKRAIKITELQEQLEEAKNIIARFVWPSDCTTESNQKFKQHAARFAGCEIPQYKQSDEAESDAQEIFTEEVRKEMGLL